MPLATVIGKLDLPSRGRDFLSLALPHIYVCWYVDMCSSVCGHVCAGECAHVCTRRWRPEGNVGCRMTRDILSTLFSEARFLTEPGSQRFDWSSWVVCPEELPPAPPEHKGSWAAVEPDQHCCLHWDLLSALRLVGQAPYS